MSIFCASRSGKSLTSVLGLDTDNTQPHEQCRIPCFVTWLRARGEYAFAINTEREVHHNSDDGHFGQEPRFQRQSLCTYLRTNTFKRGVAPKKVAYTDSRGCSIKSRGGGGGVKKQGYVAVCRDFLAEPRDGVSPK